MEEVAMGFHVLAAISLAVVALAPAAGAAAPNEAGAPAGRAAFERLKALVGSWEAESPGGRRVRLTYELAAGGSVLVERYTAGDLPGGETMLTTYYLDGERLMLTHYCVAGNQPRLRAERFDPGAGELEFEFAGASNLPDPNAGHIRRAKFRFEDADRFTGEWEWFEKGRLAKTEVLRYRRVR
jgi:hypothetical protein